jgi:hypothetical protein
MAHTILARLAVLTTIATACVVTPSPPPTVTVTSPERSMVRHETGPITVKGIALPSPGGADVAKVTVNNVPATLAPDGTFTAVVDLPPGAMLLETVATSEEGASATDARAVHVGQLRPVDSNIDRAITASLSADAFAKLSNAASAYIKTLDLPPLLPVVELGDSIANLKITVTKLTIADAKFALVPVDGGLTFSAEITGLDLAANVRHAGALLPNGTVAVGVKSDKITIGATLLVADAGMAGFTSKLASPAITTTNLKLNASGLTGQFLSLLQNNLSSTINRFITRSAESALEPLINTALGALAGPQSIDVLDYKVHLQASPAALAFSRAGALVTMNIAAKIDGSSSSPGFIYTPNGTPTMKVGDGIQIGLSDDLVNQLLAQVHALKLLDIHVEKDVGLFDAADFKLSVPPMISANNADGKLRLVLGDMVASFSNNGTPVISAAVNAQVDLEILRGNNPQEIALEFGTIQLYVSLLDESGESSGDDGLSGIAKAGIGVQLKSLEKFLVTVPVPEVAGVTLDNLALRADNGYVLVSGKIN